MPSTTEDWFFEEPVVIETPLVASGKKPISYQVGSFEEEDFRKFQEKYGQRFNNVESIWRSDTHD